MNYSVESPSNKKDSFSQINTVRVGDGDKYSGDMGFHYEDSIISIDWVLLERSYHFTFINKTVHTIKINWDDVAYVSSDGSSCKMIHGKSNFLDFKDADPYKTQVATSIPRGVKYDDYLIPVKNFKRDDNEWDLSEEFFRYVTPWSRERIERQKGNTTMIQIPIVIENVQNDYLFSFQVNDIDTFEQEKVFSKGKTTGLSVGLGVGSGVAILLLLLLL